MNESEPEDPKREEDLPESGEEPIQPESPAPEEQPAEDAPAEKPETEASEAPSEPDLTEVNVEASGPAEADAEADTEGPIDPKEDFGLDPEPFEDHGCEEYRKTLEMQAKRDLGIEDDADSEKASAPDAEDDDEFYSDEHEDLYDYERDHANDPYKELHDEHRDSEDADGHDDSDPFEAVAASIEENLESGRKRIGSDGNEMGFLEHLEDLRGTIFKSLIAFLVSIVLMTFFLTKIGDLLQRPYYTAVFAAKGEEQFSRPGDEVYSESELRERMLDRVEDRYKLITSRPMEVFTVIIQTVFMGALGISLPFVLYFIAQFVAPGLTSTELSVLRPGCIAAFILFLSGASFGYFLVIPPALFFSINLNDMLGFQELWSAANYYSLIVWLTIGVGTLFQFPLILVLLCYIGVLSASMLREHRKVIVVIILVVSALITPGGDPVTLVILSLPLYGLFEAAVIVAALLEKRQNQELEKSED